MTVWNLGSINADLFYDVPHLPGPGETLATESFRRGLGGKGANMSVAAARAGARVHHLGAVGSDGQWAIDRLDDYSVDTRFIRPVDAPTGHAIIAVDAEGENFIIILGGANRAIPEDLLQDALSQARAGDHFITQNETSQQVEGARMARDLGLKVVYAAAPFDAAAVSAMLPYLDLLVLNAVEANQLEAATGKKIEDLNIPDVIVTLGAGGACWVHNAELRDFPAFKVTPVDTTGAGDTFTGYLVAGLDRGLDMPDAISQAMRAGALMVMRKGTADVIPLLSDVKKAQF